MAEAMARQEAGGNAKASKDKGRDEVEQALDGVSTQIERQRAQQERHDDTGQTDQEVHRIDALKVALAGEDISAVNQDRQGGVKDVLDGKGAAWRWALASADGCLSAWPSWIAKAGEHAADRLIGRHVGADGDRAWRTAAPPDSHHRARPDCRSPSTRPTSGHRTMGRNA